MQRGQSVFLDVWRITAACVVAFAHLSHPLYHPGGIDLVAYGSDAVIVFFVISGFVISYAANRPNATAGGFAFDRASRLYSVAIPALALTLVLDQIGWRLAPSGYAPFGEAAPDIGVVSAFALSFAGEWSLGPYRIGTNTPWWSLSYEAAYYFLFFVIMFMRGPARIALAIGAAVLFGPKVLLLAPAWILGVLAERILRTPTSRPPRWDGFIAVAALLVYAALANAGIRELCLAATSNALGEELFHSLNHAKRFIWDWLLAGLFTLHLIAGCRALRAIDPGRIGRAAQWIAGATFSLYLIHLPVAQFTYAVGGAKDWDAPLWAASGVVAVIALAFAACFERPLPRMRARLKQLRRGAA